MSDRVTSLTDWISDAFRLRYSPPTYWAHKETRFDISHSLLGLRTGEEILKYFNEVIDSKGNAGIFGSFWITNMRILWFFPAQTLNLSIGWDTVHSIFKAKTHKSSVAILASYKSKFEFIFTCEQEHFLETLVAVFNAYKKSKPYRETITSSTDLFSNGQVKILKKETSFEKVVGVFHLSGDVGTIGNLVITSVRLVWYTSDSLTNLNIPYLQTTNISMEKSKYGEVLVLYLQAQAKNYTFGFRVDPIEKLRQLERQISSLWRVYHDKPIFGVEVEEDELDVVESDDMIHNYDELQLTVQDTDELRFSTDDLGEQSSEEIIYNEYLGLAIQKIGQESSIQSIWEESF